MPYVKQLLIAGFIVLTVFGLGQRFLFSDWKTNLDGQQVVLDDLKRKNDATDRFRLERDALQNEADSAKARYRDIEKLLPSAFNSARIFEGIKLDARGAGLRLVRFDNTHPPYKLGLNESPLRIETEGAFKDQRAFLSRLAGIPQILVFREQSVTTSDFRTTRMILNGAAPIDLPTQDAVSAANAAPTEKK